MRSRPTILASASALGAELQPEGGAELLAGRCYSGELGRGGMGVWVPDGRRALWTDPSRDPRVVSCFAHCCRSACGAGRGTGQAPHGAPVDARVQENVQCAARRGAAGMSRVPLYRSAIPGNDSRNYPRFAHPGAGGAVPYPRPRVTSDRVTPASASRRRVRRARPAPWSGARGPGRPARARRPRNKQRRAGGTAGRVSALRLANIVVFSKRRRRSLRNHLYTGITLYQHAALRAARVRDATSIELANN